MPVVAVAGGTGKLGRTIIGAILKQDDHEVVVLARATSEAKEKELGVRILSVDYNDVEAVSKTLVEHHVETVIATFDSLAGPDPELALIKAAEASRTTKRYIPSWWGNKYTPESAAIFPLAGAKLLTLEALKKTNLEYTTVITGFFTDYYVPSIPSNMGPLTMILDIPNNKAAIPGSGDVPVSFTHTADVGRFAASLLGLSAWPEESYIIGETLTLKEFVAVVEEAKGEKFDVVYDPVEKLEKGEVTELPGHRDLYVYMPREMLQGFSAAVGLMFEKGYFDYSHAMRLTNVEAQTVRQLVAQSWKE